MMIDLNRPLQLSDGTPVHVATKSDRLVTVHVPTDHPMYRDAPITRNFNLDGSRGGACGSAGFHGIRLENVPPAAFDPSKPVAVRDGRAARIIATDLKKDRPIVAAITHGDGTESVVVRRADGRSSDRDLSNDLVNVEPTKTTYVSLGDGFTVGRDDAVSEERALQLARDEDPYGFGVLKVVQQGDKLISAELVTQ